MLDSLIPKNVPFLSVVAVAGLVALLGGFFASRILAPAERRQDESKPAAIAGGSLLGDGKRTSPGVLAMRQLRSSPGGDSSGRSASTWGRLRSVVAAVCTAEPKDMRALYYQAMQLPVEAEREGTVDMILAHWLEVDPEGFFVEALANEGNRQLRKSTGKALEKWAHADPQAAVEVVLTMPVGNRRPDMVSSVFRAFGKLLPNAALASSCQTRHSHAHRVSRNQNSGSRHSLQQSMA